MKVIMIKYNIWTGETVPAADIIAELFNADGSKEEEDSLEEFQPALTPGDYIFLVPR